MKLQTVVCVYGLFFLRFFKIFFLGSLGFLTRSASGISKPPLLMGQSSFAVELYVAAFAADVGGKFYSRYSPTWDSCV